MTIETTTTMTAEAKALPRYMRLRHLCGYFGISAKEIAKLIEAGVFVPRYFNGCGRAFYLRDEVLAAEQAGRVFSPRAE